MVRQSVNQSFTMSSPLAETTAAEAPEPKTDDMLVKEWNGVLSNGDERSLRSIADAIIKLSKLDTAELKAEGLRKVAAENIARTDQITPMIHGCIRLLAHEGYGRAEDAEKDDTTEGAAGNDLAISHRGLQSWHAVMACSPIYDGARVTLLAQTEAQSSPYSRLQAGGPSSASVLSSSRSTDRLVRKILRPW